MPRLTPIPHVLEKMFEERNLSRFGLQTSEQTKEFFKGHVGLEVINHQAREVMQEEALQEEVQLQQLAQEHRELAIKIHLLLSIIAEDAHAENQLSELIAAENDKSIKRAGAPAAEMEKQAEQHKEKAIQHYDSVIKQAEFDFNELEKDKKSLKQEQQDLEKRNESYIEAMNNIKVQDKKLEEMSPQEISDEIAKREKEIDALAEKTMTLDDRLSDYDEQITLLVEKQKLAQAELQELHDLKAVKEGTKELYNDKFEKIEVVKGKELEALKEAAYTADKGKPLVIKEDATTMRGYLRGAHHYAQKDAEISDKRVALHNKIFMLKEAREHLIMPHYSPAPSPNSPSPVAASPAPNMQVPKPQMGQRLFLFTPKDDPVPRNLKEFNELIDKKAKDNPELAKQVSLNKLKAGAQTLINDIFLKQIPPTENLPETTMQSLIKYMETFGADSYKPDVTEGLKAPLEMSSPADSKTAAKFEPPTAPQMKPQPEGLVEEVLEVESNTPTSTIEAPKPEPTGFTLEQIEGEGEAPTTTTAPEDEEGLEQPGAPSPFRTSISSGN